jgi:hypothetical protein
MGFVARLAGRQAADDRRRTAMGTTPTKIAVLQETHTRSAQSPPCPSVQGSGSASTSSWQIGQ